MEKAGFETVSCSPICDAGNLWGVFKLSKSLPVQKDLDSLHSSAIECLNEITSIKWRYHMRTWNYFKFFQKFIFQIIEKFGARGKSGRQILDELYS